MPNEKMVKVFLRGSEPDDVEGMWATQVGDHLYCLDNSPFYAYGVSWKDVVEARPDEDGVLEFDRVVEKSGHRTIRVILEKTSENESGKRILDRVVEMGCTYEGMNNKLICIDLPASVSLEKIAEFLTEQEDLIWEYADPTYEEVTGESPESEAVQ